MAIIQNPLDQDEQKKKDEQALGAGLATGSSQESAYSGDSAGGVAPSGSPSAGGFVNLARYLDVNSGQAASAANNVVGSLQDKANDAQKQAEKFQQDTAKQASDNVAKYNGLNKESAQNLSKGYQGPNSLDSAGSYGQYQTSKQGFLNSANQLKDQGVQGEVLKQQAQKKAAEQNTGYTRGMGALDAAMLTRQQDAIKGGIDNMVNAYNTKASDAEKAAQSAIDAARGTYDTARNSFFSDSEAQKANILRGKNDLLQSKKAAYQDELKNVDKNNRMVDAERYINRGSDYSLGDVMNDDEISRFAELSDLQAILGRNGTNADLSRTYKGAMFDQAGWDKDHPMPAAIPWTPPTMDEIMKQAPNAGNSGPAWIDPNAIDPNRPDYVNHSYNDPAKPKPGKIDPGTIPTMTPGTANIDIGSIAPPPAPKPTSSGGSSSKRTSQKYSKTMRYM